MIPFESYEMDEVTNLQNNTGYLRDHFEKSILEHEIYQNNPRKANRLFHEIHGTFKKLKTLNALGELEKLLDHSSVAVRNFAAKYYLLVDEQRALKTLAELAKLDGIDGFAAQDLINRWKKGELHFDY